MISKGSACDQAARLTILGDWLMGSFSIWHWLIVIAVVALLFGGSGKISELMGDVAKGVKSFSKGLADDDESAAKRDRRTRRRRKKRPRSS